MFNRIGKLIANTYNNYTNFKTYNVSSQENNSMDRSNHPINNTTSNDKTSNDKTSNDKTSNDNYENGTGDEMDVDEELPCYNDSINNTVNENNDKDMNDKDMNENNFIDISPNDVNTSLSLFDSIVTDIDMDYYIKILKEKGYVIIPKVFDKNEVENYWNEFDKWRTNVPDLEYLHNIIDGNGIFKHHQVGHQRFAWQARTNPKIVNIFKKLWNTSELVTSFDGCCFYPSYYKNNPTYWTHSDQSSMKKGVNCYQSFLSLTDNIERTLIVYEGTHEYHQHYFETMGIEEPKNWNIIDKDYLMNNHLDKQKFLHVKAGDLVIWDSRTFHQNTSGSLDCKEERLIQYLCYLPKDNEKNDEKEKKQRAKFFEKKRTTSHWPYPMNVVPEQPNFYNYYYPDCPVYIDYSNLPKPQLDDLLPEIKKLL